MSFLRIGDRLLLPWGPSVVLGGGYEWVLVMRINDGHRAWLPRSELTGET